MTFIRIHSKDLAADSIGAHGILTTKQHVASSSYLCTTALGGHANLSKGETKSLLFTDTRALTQAKQAAGASVEDARSRIASAFRATNGSLVSLVQVSDFAGPALMSTPEE